MSDPLVLARATLFNRDLPENTRLEALWKLRDLPEEEELLAVTAAVLRSADELPGLRREAAFSLGRISLPGVREVLEPFLDASEPELRAGAIYSLNNERDLFPRFVAALSDPAPVVRHWAGDAVGWLLGGCGDEEDSPRIDPAPALEPLLRCLEDGNLEVRQSAAYALSYLDDPRVIEPLAAHLEDPDEYARSRVVFALACHGDARALPAGLALLTSPDPSAQGLAVDALARLPGPGARRALQGMLGGNQPLVAARALGLLGDRRAISSLKRAATTRDRRLRQAARRAIRRLRRG
jgi:HEAT repeat protein